MRLSDWHAWLREGGCVITGYRGEEVQLHHCHGGSISDLGFVRGRGQKTSNWLVLPLFHSYHVGTGHAFHQMGVRSWEDRYGTQANFLRDLGTRAGINPFDLAAEEEKARGLL